METDADYYFRRARQERSAATLSPTKIVHERHLELAQAYEFRAREMAAARVHRFAPVLEVVA